MADYANLSDLKDHWPALRSDQEAEALQKLLEASIEVRTSFPGIDARLASGELNEEVPRLVVCRMIKRAMDTPNDAMAGVGSVTHQGGPFAQTLNFTNPDGNIYLSKSDRNLLSPVEQRRAFMIHPGGV